MRDASGVLYGTTTSGGTSNMGTVFELVAGGRVMQTLYNFSGPDGATPSYGPLVPTNGLIYGTTFARGNQ